MTKLSNVADHLRTHAKQRPDQPALIVPDGERWTSISYRELNARVDRFARGFEQKGLRRGDRVLFLVKPGIEFYSALFGLFRMGAIPVLMDPGMGLKNLLQCIEQAKPRAVLALPVVHVVRLLKRKSFRSADLFITAGTRWFWGGHTLVQCEAEGDEPHVVEGARSADDEGFIAFTSGSTGPPKGVSFVQRMFLEQSRLIGHQYGIAAGSTTVECFAAFVIFDLAMGLTVVIPDMDLSKPAKADPANVVRAIEDHKATSAFASPIVWQKVSRWCQDKGKTLPELRTVLTAGAPIPAGLHRRFREILADGVQLHTPYGATESLPVSTIGSDEVLADTWTRTSEGHGTCVGHAFPEVQVEIVRVSEEPYAEWSDDLRVADGEIGEIAVFASIVSPEYKDRPDANALSKIRRDGRIGHRMGDLGYRDDAGRLWFCGRKSHALWVDPAEVTAPGVRADGLLPAVPIEGVFNEHPSVFRTAVVGVGAKGHQRPVLVVELEQGKEWSGDLGAEIMALADGSQWAGVVSHVLHNPGFPVDPRHNSKIKRGEILDWVESHYPDLVPA
ncbi:MAG: fatty acid CoA ligase family protein [Myxococcota bacterium]